MKQKRRKMLSALLPVSSTEATRWTRNPIYTLLRKQINKFQLVLRYLEKIDDIYFPVW